MKLEKKFQRASQARGITLVALVITIIIIIILATVTINMAFNGGIIDKAELASDMYANDTAYTDSSMANVVGYLDEMLNGVTGGGTDEPEEPEQRTECCIFGRFSYGIHGSRTGTSGYLDLVSAAEACI